MRDLSPYVGIPYVDKGTDPTRGLDCWQLVRHFYARELGQQIPDYLALYRSALVRREATAAIVSALPDWRPVADPQFGDVLLFRISNAPWHTAVALDAGHMLHTERGHNSVIESRLGLRWRSRLYGTYRWKS
jgi:cell wall-associated NlpC family hydrolase